MALLFSVAYNLSKWGIRENICFVFVNPQNSMISDMPVLFQ